MNRSNIIPIVALMITAIALIPAFGQWLSPRAPVNSLPISNDVEKRIAPRQLQDVESIQPSPRLPTPVPTNPVTSLPTFTATSIPPTDAATTTSISINTPVSLTSTSEPTPEVFIVENTSTPLPAVNSAVRIVVEGFGVAPNTLTDPVRRERAAILAAEVDAKRKLAEWIAGAQIEAVTVVSQGTLVTDVIRQIVQAKVPAPTIIQQEYDSATGHAYVTLELVVENK